MPPQSARRKNPAKRDVNRANIRNAKQQSEDNKKNKNKKKINKY